MITRLKQQLAVLSARTRQQLSPTSDNVGKLARTFLDAGKVEDSARVLSEGLERYPALSDLEDVAHFVAQVQLRHKEEELNNVLEETRQAYYDLAMAHLSVGDLKLSTEVIWAGLQRFPDSAPLYRCLGEIHLGLFLEDFLPRDGTSAAENLDRAAQLDETDLLPHRYLAGFFLRVGAYNRAAGHLRQLLDRMTSAENDYALLESLLVRCQQKTGENGSERSLTDLLEGVYISRVPVEDLGDWGRPVGPALRRRDVSLMEVTPSILRRTVLDFLPQSKATGAVLVSEGAAVLLGEMPFPGDVHAMPELVRALEQATAEAVHRMELGHCRCTLVQLSGGALGSVILHNATVMFLFGPGQSTNSVSATLKHFTDWLARALGESREGNTGTAEPERRN